MFSLKAQTSNMNKYFLFFQTYWSYILSYRTSWLLWRLRQFMLSFMALSLWTAVYAGSSSVFGYDRAELFSYIFLTTLLQNIILSTSLNSLGTFIYSGDISNIVIKPISMLAYLVSRDVADKLFNTISTVFEMCILWFIFRPEILWPSLSMLPYLLLTVIFGIIISFCIQILFGSIGFWSPDTWGPRFLFYILVDLTSGKLFPLDILPQYIQNLLFLTPFPYFTYAQVQLALGRSTSLTAFEILSRSTLWVILLAFCAYFVWKKGMNQYQAAGQ